VSGLENSADPSFPLVVQVVLTPTLKEADLTALQEAIITAIRSGNLSTALESAGMGAVETAAEAVEVGTGKLPEPISPGGLPDDVPHVSTRVVVIGETVESFDAGKQDELKEALGDHLGLLASDLEVVLMSETTIDEREVVMEVRGFPTATNVSLTDVARKIKDAPLDVLDQYNLPLDAGLEEPATDRDLLQHMCMITEC
jgi:hypothetical protein